MHRAAVLWRQSDEGKPCARMASSASNGAASCLGVGDRMELPRRPGYHDLLRCEARVAAHDQHPATPLPNAPARDKEWSQLQLAVDVKSVLRAQAPLRAWLVWSCNSSVLQVTSRRQRASGSDRSIALCRVTVWLVTTDKVPQRSVLPSSVVPFVAQFGASSPTLGEDSQAVRHLIYPSSLEPQIDRTKQGYIV